MAASKHRLNARAEESPAPATTPMTLAAPAPAVPPALPTSPAVSDVSEMASAPPPLPAPPQFPPLTALPPGYGGSDPAPEWSTKGPSIVWGLLAYLNSRDRIWASVYRSRRPLRTGFWMFGAGLVVGQGRLIESVLGHIT